MSPCFNCLSGPPAEMLRTGATEMLRRKGTRKAGKLRTVSLHHRARRNGDCRSKTAKMTNVQGLRPKQQEHRK